MKKGGNKEVALNWSPEVIMDLTVGTIFLIGVVIILTNLKKKIISLYYFVFIFFCFSLFFYLEGLSFLFLNTTLGRIYNTISFPALISLLLVINYTKKENIFSLNLIPIFCLGTLLCYLAFDPKTATIIIEDGYPTIIWTGLFNIIGILMLVLFSLYFFYWAVKTWIHAPIEIKKEATIFLYGDFFMSIINLVIYTFTFWISSLILLADVFVAIGALIIIFVILKEPKLLYVLPFKIYRIIVKDHSGTPLFDYDWTNSSISDSMLSKLLSSILQMSEKVMNVGEILDLNLKDGILIFHECELISIGLFASNSSKFLRNSLKKFSLEFEKKFGKELKEEHRDTSKFDSAKELIEKYFSNLPSRIMSDEKQQLFFSEKYLKIPAELNDKLQNIFVNKEEYDLIKAEILRCYKCSIPEFLKLYDELEDEFD